MSPAVMRAIADAADALARLARAAAEDAPRDPGELLPVAEAARVAATSVRVLRDAIRAGLLPAHGGQRDRSVRRSDLDAWIATRAAPVRRVEQGQAGRVEARLARAAERGRR
jgi:hypothetical protein